MNYLLFVFENRRFLAFGVLLTLCSNFGQTSFLALFSGHIRDEFALSHGDFGTIYSMATLTSAFCLIWVGRRIDDVDLRLYASLACAGIAAACFSMAAASSAIALYFALFLLRMTGQGLMGHTASTSMARYFDRQRGKAMSVVYLGHPLGEATLPSIAVALVGAIGWHRSWVVFGSVLAVSLAPLVLWLLKGHGERHHRLVERTKTGSEAAPSQRQWTHRDVLSDSRFYFILPNALAPPFILTGMFFHQVHLADTKGWSLTWLATCFIGYAAATVISSLSAGVLVDRLGAVRLLPFYLLPLALGLVIVAAFTSPIAALFYMAAAGLSAGAGNSIVGAMWAEVYGVAHLGAIRALASALMVFSTALSPAISGLLIDAGVTMEAIALMAVGYIAVSVVLVKIPKLDAGG